MKIINLTAENVKKLKVIDITPTKDFIQITGRNGSGKTSVLDAIWWALSGKDHIQGKPIRDGEEKARIRLDLGDIVVERRFTKGGTSLIVENAEGARYPSPQAMLDAIVGQLAFDPLEFARMQPKQQFEMLRTVAKLEVDLDALARDDKADYDARTAVNRDVKMLEGQLAGIQVPENAPDQPVDTAALMRDLEARNHQNEAARSKQRELNVLHETQRSLIAERDEINVKIAATANKIHSMEIPPLMDTSSIMDSLANARSTNEAHSLKKRHAETAKLLKEKKDASDSLSKSLEKRAAERDKALKESQMPVKGISFGDQAVLLNGIPFDQASSAEQIRTSVAIAMATNPKLRIIRIKDGSLLDDDALRIVQEMTGDGDYQVWCERVDASGKVGIYMENGAIVTNNDSEAVKPETGDKVTVPTFLKKSGEAA